VIMVELDQDEARAVAARFGVAIEQVRRDHLLSQVLAAISNAHADRVIFFGGTALARTYLPEGRLSEDVDLIAVGSRAETAAAIEKTLRSALRRSHGRIAWAPALTAIRDTDAAVLVADDGQLSVRIQLLDRLGYELWPTSMQAIEQRYRDAPAASLRVPTAAAFAAWKTVAWHDRGALRVGNAGLTPLETWIGGAVVHELRREALSDDALGEIAGPVTGAKTANRQILGFMNEMAIHADCAIDRRRRGSRCDTDVLNRKLRRMLHDRDGRYATPPDLVAERRASGRHDGSSQLRGVVPG
jgi:hypothetical protein